VNRVLFAVILNARCHLLTHFVVISRHFFSRYALQRKL
jgi:hypothetical protein